MFPSHISEYSEVPHRYMMAKDHCMWFKTIAQNNIPCRGNYDSLGTCIAGESKSYLLYSMSDNMTTITVALFLLQELKRVVFGVEASPYISLIPT